ncbi:OmpA family protein [Streptomyces sp. B93]|uniref:OmpA family protein n=1 Tax=Streptomyces sp. B93 TaxID=2824875 RepID=UPI0027E4CDD2|nr:OmpA family protein [Streptomyces sp. B93]
MVEDVSGAEHREETSSEVTVRLQAEVLFAKDSARLGSSAVSRIASVGEEIRQQSPQTVQVYGYTDDLGSFAHGETLSQQRAEAVHMVLANALGSIRVTFQVRGLGERNPVVPNTTEAGRQKNRRVEISFPRVGGPSL